jgi:aspartyl-tRNA(Asn)/glutamyl-tRNA(Gln) amidotransferase subunit A
MGEDLALQDAVESTRFETRLPRAQPAADGDLSWTPAWRIREMVASRALSPVEVVDHFLARIADLNPRLHAFREVDVDGARDQARRAEAAVMSGAALGPLHGVPVASKEFLPIAGRSWWDMSRPGHARAERDSVEIERLRAAGAVILGPTVAGLVAREFGASDRMPLNPWDTDRVCGDSSSGSACATASAMTPIAIAGDGLGSTRLPASFCGLVGLHPTRGRVPTFEWTRLNSRLLSTYGPHARDVRDAATVLSVLAGPDGRDMICLPDDPPDYLAGLDDGASGMRLLWTDDFGYAGKMAVAETPRVIDTVRRAAQRLEGAGAHIGSTDQAFEDPAWAAHQWLMTDPVIASRRDPPPEDAARVREARLRIWTALRQALSGRDFLVCPTILCVAPTRAAWAGGGVLPEFSGLYTAMTGVANLLGWPALSVPAGLVDGLPVGLQILGRPNSEPRMLQLAQAFLTVQG